MIPANAEPITATSGVPSVIPSVEITGIKIRAATVWLTKVAVVSVNRMIMISAIHGASSGSPVIACHQGWMVTDKRIEQHTPWHTVALTSSDALRQVVQQPGGCYRFTCSEQCSDNAGMMQKWMYVCMYGNMRWYTENIAASHQKYCVPRQAIEVNLNMREHH